LIVRVCSKPKCPYIAVATLSFNYSEKVARLSPLSAQRHLGEYDLCGKHADRMCAPKSWQFEKLVHDFPEPELAPKPQGASKLPAQNARVEVTTQATRPRKTLAERIRQKRRQTDFPDDDLTALMRSVRDSYSSPAIPSKHQGTKRRNLVAVRTGDTSQNLQTVLPEAENND
jgi:hypothetical protein